jgi:hypothetical protein
MSTVPVGYANPGDPYFVLTAEQISSIVTDLLEILPGGAIINGWDDVQHAAIIFNKVTDGQNFVNLGIQNGLVPNPLLPGTSTLSKMLTVENDLLNYDFIGVSQVNLFGDGQVADPSRLAGVISGDGRGNVYVPNCLISSLTVSSILGFYPTVQIISTFSSAKIFNLTVSSINGTEYPPPPPPLVSTFSNIDVSSINGAAYPPITPVISTFSNATISSLNCYQITNPENTGVNFTNSFAMPTGTGFSMLSPIQNATFVVSNPKTSAFEALTVDSANTELGAGFYQNLLRITAPSFGTYRFTFGMNNGRFASWDALDTGNSTGFPIIVRDRPSTILQCSQISSFNTGNIQVSSLNAAPVPWVQYGQSTFQASAFVITFPGYPDANYTIMVTPTDNTVQPPHASTLTNNSFQVHAGGGGSIGIPFYWTTIRNNY